MRLIDASRFEKSIQLSIDSWGRDCNNNAPVIERTYKDVLSRIKNAPTVDAVEVVQGEWVVCGDSEYVPFMCSACGKTTSWYHAQTANYCPNCGAKMDGDAK